MYDYDDEVATIERGGKRYRSSFGCHNKKRAEEEVKALARYGKEAIIVPVRSYWVCVPKESKKNGKILIGS